MIFEKVAKWTKINEENESLYDVVIRWLHELFCMSEQTEKKINQNSEQIWVAEPSNTFLLCWLHYG